MPIVARSNFTPVDYIPTSERDEENPTKFQLKPLNGMEHMRVLNHITTNADGETMVDDTGIELALKHGLIGATNLVDEDGNDVGLNRFTRNSIPFGVLVELATKILAITNMTGDARKNS